MLKKWVLRSISLLLFVYCKSVSAECSAINLPTNSISLLTWAEISSYLQSQTIYYDQAELAVKTELTLLGKLLTSNSSDDGDEHLEFPEMAENHGYSVEKYNVTTTDKYVLTMFRIKGDGPPVFLMHGILTDAIDWIANGPELALGYFLADKGYDVWFGNTRGNKYSQYNTEYSVECAEFWDYSWHEIGIYDLPAMVDFILEDTGKSQLSYVGFSQGTTVAFVLCSERPEYNDKFNIIIALAPVAWMSHLKSPLVRIATLGLDVLYYLFSLLGLNDIAPADNILITTVLDIVCADNIIAKDICSNLLFLIMGYDSGQLNFDRLPVFLGYTPAGTSIKQIVHYGQEILSANFSQFDYGTEKNLEVYGNAYPPNYNVENVTSPVALFFSNADWFSNITDVNILKGKLPNVVYTQLNENYNHVDNIYASNTDTVINANIWNLLQNYSTTEE